MKSYFIIPTQMPIGDQTWLEMLEGARRLEELWVEHLMDEQIKALQKIWGAMR